MTERNAVAAFPFSLPLDAPPVPANSPHSKAAIASDSTAAVQTLVKRSGSGEGVDARFL
jgi:hypothetical protein